MTRRHLIAALAAIPLLGRFAPEPDPTPVLTFADGTLLREGPTYTLYDGDFRDSSPLYVTKIDYETRTVTLDSTPKDPSST